MIYRQLLFDEQLLHEQTHKLNQKFDLQMYTVDLVKYIKVITKQTISVKLRSFQYRLCANAVITNVNLKHFGVINVDSCSFCRNNHETVKHLFMECLEVDKLWKYFSEVYDFNYDNEKLLFNSVEPNPKSAKNCIVLIIKFYIYRTQCLNQRLSVQGAKNYLEEYIAIEEQIAKSKGKTNMHILKWSLK